MSAQTKPLKSPKTRALAGRVAALTRSRPADDPEYLETRRLHRESLLADHIKNLVDQAPPLTSEQRTRLASLLSPAPSAANGGAVA